MSEENTADQMQQAALNVRFPELEGEPEKGKWYRVTLPGCVCGNGNKYHVGLRVGKSTRLMVIFVGGGLSYTEYMAQRPVSVYYPVEESYYIEDIEPLADFWTELGIGNLNPDNPFHDWSMLCINYSSADLHVGRGDFPYRTEEGEKILHHHGYLNFQAAMEKVKKYIPEPEKLLVAGGSGGGFGAALLTDDIMQMFPDCSDVTCCVDAALFLHDDWQSILKTWNAPEEIWRRIRGRNIVLEALTALYQKYGKSVRCMFVSSVRDGSMAQFQGFMDGGDLVIRRKRTERYQQTLKEMCQKLQEMIPNVGLYVYDLPFPGIDEKERATLHTIIQSDTFMEKLSDNVSVMDWLWDAVNGKTGRYGLNLLDQ